MSLFAFAPSRGPRWQIGLQAALGIGVPIAVMTLLGQPVLGYIAASGAFTVLYAASSPVVERARILPLIALGLIVCAALGVIVAHSPLLLNIGIVVISIGAAVAVIGVVAARRAAIQRAQHRLLGTIAGAGVYALLALLHPRTPVTPEVPV